MKLLSGIKKIGYFEEKSVYFNWDEINHVSESYFKKDEFIHSFRILATILIFIVLGLLLINEIGAGELPFFDFSSIQGTNPMIILLLISILLFSAVNLPQKKQSNKFTPGLNSIFINTVLSKGARKILAHVFTAPSGYIDEIFTQSIEEYYPKFAHSVAHVLGVSSLSECIHLIEFKEKRYWIETILLDSLQLATNTNSPQITPELLFFAFLYQHIDPAKVQELFPQ
ncbi:hypothetical protein KC717_03340 [Candidatus Dojkabacteria bacterium]|uniref:Uncharacterized protein n=1 Tax=Candidatus Dojkabacteria bacterium TaxID=2099670 RepID=A0A955L8J2_9BACT|nr:hypothetical protein [Candidatus Dojkabacteria bacterium]